MFLYKFWEIFFPEILAKIFSTKQIAGFFNQPFLQIKYIKHPKLLHVDTNSHELKVDKNVRGGYGQKWVRPVLSWDSKIDCISRMN